MSNDIKMNDNNDGDNDQDLYLGKPIDRRGRTLTEEQAVIFNRYNNWKNNLMALYNHIEVYALPYPARTVQFLPNAKKIISSENQHKQYTNYPFLYPSYCRVPKQETPPTNSSKSTKSTKSKKSANNSSSNNSPDSSTGYLFINCCKLCKDIYLN